MHKLKMMHREYFPLLFSLKLQNVMIGKEMEIKLIDFGITKMG